MHLKSLSALVALVASLAHAGIIESGEYADAKAAQAAWAPMAGSPPPRVATIEGHKVLHFPCNFQGTTHERASWDRKVKLDLSACRGVQFKLWCGDPSPVSYFSLYFQSGGGWYHAAFFPETTNGWNVITIDKSATTSEGEPAGWGRISAIRFSAWRGQDRNTDLYFSDLRETGVLGDDALIAVVRGESIARVSSGEARSVERFTEAVAQALQASDLGCAVVSDLDVTAERLRGVKLVILPHNPSLPDRAADELIAYVRSGGKLLVFYVVPGALRPVLGVEGGQHISAPRPGHFSAMRFEKGALPGAPPVVGQKSWNISVSKPVPGSGRVLAEWIDDQDQPTGHAAVVGSANGLVMTHVMLPDDAANKRRMLLAMAGHLVPELWRRAVEAGLERLGTIGEFRSYDEAIQGIRRLAGGNARTVEALAETEQSREVSRKRAAEGRYAEALDAVVLASEKLERAYCLAQRSLPGEFRAFWCHSAFGVDGIAWDEAIRRLATNGFTAVVPNMLWGGVAFYQSAILPVAPSVAQRGDQIAECVAAARKHGVQVHVWKVNWNLGHAAPKEFVDQIRTAGRLQSSREGKEESWLCPSHPDNQKLEIESMLEVARRYDVDGLHFDYIRYPDSEHCFCAGCRQRFEQAARTTFGNWPADVLARSPLHEQWLEWRRGHITAVVKAVSEQARAIKPKIKISAAVFPRWTTDRASIGQDWKLWCERGYLDFVCPMNYTPSDRNFENMLAQQVQWAGSVPCYPGIGVSASSSKFGVDRTIAQIQIARRHRTGGFIIFNYGVPESRDLLPLLGLGITAPD